jgi:gamma-glutamyltranspeptidase/glutathione hydrolase
MEVIARDGVDAIYRGTFTDALVQAVHDEGGSVTRTDLDAYRGTWRRPVRTRFRGHEFVSNPPPSSGGVLIAYGLALLERLESGARAGSAEAIAALAETMREQTRARGRGFSRDLHRGGLAARLLDERALAAAVERMRTGGLAGSEPGPLGGTTHVSAVDADGNAASLSTSTGSGSGVIVPGTGIHLNNMLGEYDLVAGGPAAPGRRLTSMMAPSIVLGDHGPRLVVGSAGSVRLRGAIMQIVVNVLEHGLDVDDAIAAARVHVDDPHVHCEGGHDPSELDRLEAMGYDVVRWRRRNLFFGGAAAVEVADDGSLAAAGDPRRGGAGVVVGA